MSENDPEERPESGSDASGWAKQTEFGEPLWLDVLKTLGVGLGYLLIILFALGAFGTKNLEFIGRNYAAGWALSH